MNKLTKELAEKAGFYFDEYNEATQRKVELLIELIVRECGNVAFNHWCNGTNESSAQLTILRQFGVYE